MPWSHHPAGPPIERLGPITEQLDPVLLPLGFAPGQIGVTGDTGQVVFCRGARDSVDGGCVDLVVDVEAAPEWRIVDVRYWGFTTNRWHLDFLRDAPLGDQLAHLARTVGAQLTDQGR